MVEKLDDMETKLNEQIDHNITLNKRLAESTADVILDQISEGLATTQKEKLASLAESVEFESEQEYREKLETLKESYFSRTPATKSEAPQTLSEGVDTTEAPISGGMDQYLKAMGAFRQN
jgi:chromosome condensin MukBEF complex kleisin-like MukF subunit